MVRIFPLILLLVLLNGLPATAGQIRIEIAEQVEVSGSKIYLGDIAEIGGADPETLALLRAVYLGEAPLPGQRRTMTLSLLRMRLQQAKLPLGELELVVPSTFQVTTRSQLLAGEQLLGLAQRVLQEALAPYPKAQWELSSAVTDLSLPAGEVQLVPAGLPSLARTMGVPVDILIDGVIYRRVVVSFRVTLPVSVVAVADFHSKHEVLEAERLVLVERDYFTLPGMPFEGLEDLVGMRVKRWVTPGTVLTRELVEPIPEVVANQVVTLESIYGNVRAVTQVLSLQDGYIGDWIEVANPQSGRVIIAEVVGPGRVVSIMVKGV